MQQTAPGPTPRLCGLARHAGLLTALSGLAILLLQKGFVLPVPPLLERALEWVYLLAILPLAAEVILALFLIRPLRPRARQMAGDVALLLLALALLLLRERPHAAFAVVALRQVLVAAGMLAQSAPLRPWLYALEVRPLRMVALSFLAAIAVGTALLSLPAASPPGRHASPVDALFTSTSAVCVTGLIVRSTAGDWTLFGQGVILGLIQVGGLGIMALSLSVVMLLGHRLRARQRAALFQTLDVNTVSDLRASMRYLLFLTLVFEAAGCGILTLRFGIDSPTWGEATWLGLFHSVSAWNNAGFALWDDSLTRYGSDLVVTLTVLGLLVAGGLGFAVLGQVLDPANLKGGWGRAFHRWSLHTKLVLITTGVLLVLGTMALLFAEFDHGLAGLDPAQKILAAFFHSASARTAGFNTVDLARFTPLGLLLVIALMFMGASPGSTGGGIKTSTVAVIVLAIRALVLNRSNVEVFNRRLSGAVILRVVGIVVIAASAILFFFACLLALEPERPFAWLLFETVSAFGTVGLSTGITPSLGVPAKLLLTVLMFIGRTGPLTLALSLGHRGRASAIRYPEGQVVVG